MMSPQVEDCYLLGMLMKGYRFVVPYRNQVVESRDVRINENSDLNQIDDDMFEADKSTEFQGSDVQKIEHSPCDVVPIVQVAVELPQSSYGRG